MTLKQAPTLMIIIGPLCGVRTKFKSCSILSCSILSSSRSGLVENVDKPLYLEPGHINYAVDHSVVKLGSFLYSQLPIGVRGWKQVPEYMYVGPTCEAHAGLKLIVGAE